MDKDERTRARAQSQGTGSSPGVGQDSRQGEVLGQDVSWEDVMRVGRGLAHVPMQLAAMAVDGAWLLFVL